MTEERDAVSLPQHPHHPRLRSPVPPGLPMEGQTAAGQGQARGWLLLPETQRFGRRSRPLTAPKALAPSGTRGGGRALPVRPASTRRTRGGRIHKRRGGGRTRLPPPQRTRHGQVGGNQRRPLNLGDYLTEDILGKKARTRARSHSERPMLSLRHRNGGVHKEALTTLSPHEGGTSRRRMGLLRQRRRHGGQGRVEERWVRRLKAISLQHGEYSGHQPER